MTRPNPLKSLLIRTWASVGVLASLPSAQAHPVTYEGGLTVMSFNSSMMSDQWIGYSLSPRFSIAGRSLILRGDPGKREYALPQLNLLVKRWNEPDAQANIYLSAGYGLERDKAFGRGENGSAALGAVEADWESRKYYVSGKYQLIRSFNRDDSLDYVRLRAGIAPYVADFEDLHTWFIVQVERQSEFFGSIQTTPVLRFFYRNVLWEIGSSLEGQVAFNFMVHF